MMRDAMTKSRAVLPAPAVINHALGPSLGRALEPTTRASMEERFAHDFSRVRVHCSPDAARSAALLKARAYTVGDDIVFANARYAPHTACGEALLAHELGHVVQQAGARRPSVLRLSDGHAANGAVCDGVAT